MALIPNGYDNENFRDAELLPSAFTVSTGARALVLLHSGALYPSERDPRSFFSAVARLRKAGKITPETLQIRLRAPGFDSYHHNLLKESRIEDIVTISAALPYREALREMLDADGLLLFQASNCNNQVPAKLYEYLRARRPILALTDPEETPPGRFDARVFSR